MVVIVNNTIAVSSLGRVWRCSGIDADVSVSCQSSVFRASKKAALLSVLSKNSSKFFLLRKKVQCTQVLSLQHQQELRVSWKLYGYSEAIVAHQWCGIIYSCSLPSRWQINPGCPCLTFNFKTFKQLHRPRFIVNNPFRFLLRVIVTWKRDILLNHPLHFLKLKDSLSKYLLDIEDSYEIEGACVSVRWNVPNDPGSSPAQTVNFSTYQFAPLLCLSDLRAGRIPWGRAE